MYGIIVHSVRSVAVAASWLATVFNPHHSFCSSAQTSVQNGSTTFSSSDKLQDLTQMEMPSKLAISCIAWELARRWAYRKPLCELKYYIYVVMGTLSKEIVSKIKETLTKPIILAIYNPNTNTKICSDSSACGLWIVILQQQQNALWRQVAYASRGKSETEQR